MRGRGRGRATGWPGARLAIAALTAFLAGSAFAAPAGAALATGPVWSIQNSPDVTQPGGQLESVSCSSADACTAVGASSNPRGLTVTLAERWNGTSWRRQRTPQPWRTVPGSIPGLSGVSCPAPAFCEAVGTNQVIFTGIGLAYGWNGSSWKQQSFPGPPGSTSVTLDQVSCTSARFCEAVGYYRNGSGDVVALAARWNGTSWRLQGLPGSSGGPEVLLTGVSCVSTTFCVALGSSFSGTFAERWDGTAWHVRNLPQDVGLGSVSCASAAFCEAVGGSSGDVWNGSSWSAQTIPGPAGSTSASLAGVSCLTAVFCEVVGKYTDSSGNAFSLGVSWNGTSWAVQPTPNPATASGTSLSQVSCTSVAACETAGSFQQTSDSQQLALAESWNGSSWRIQHAVSLPGAIPNTLNAVSCAAAVFCEAVGSRFDSLSGATVALAEMWDGTSWQIQKTPDPVQAANGVQMNLTGVSCVSAVFCEAVGSSSAGAGGGAEVWNGTGWALQAVPGGSLTSVSCTSASFCLAAGADGHVDLWNGVAWSAQPSSPDLISLSGVSCTSATSCEATGANTSFDATAEGWNGTSWSAQTVPVPTNGSSPALTAVSCTGAGSCEAAGSYTNDTTFDQVPLAEVWNGTVWTAQSAAVPAAAFVSSLAGVWCTAANSCTAVGQYTPGTGPSATVAEVWNGVTWRLRDTPDHPYAGQNSLNGVSCGASTACTAVGTTTNPGQTQATLIEAGD